MIVTAGQTAPRPAPPLISTSSQHNHDESPPHLSLATDPPLASVAVSIAAPVPAAPAPAEVAELSLTNAAADSTSSCTGVSDAGRVSCADAVCNVLLAIGGALETKDMQELLSRSYRLIFTRHCTDALTTRCVGVCLLGGAVRCSVCCLALARVIATNSQDSCGKPFPHSVPSTGISDTRTAGKQQQD